MKKLLLILVLAIPMLVHAQEEEEKKFGIKFSGFVKSDFFVDTRQTVSAREGHFLLWPAQEALDFNGDDINAKASTNFLSIQSRLKGSITGPDAFGAKTSGVIEGDFFAQANDNINLFRLRHAFIKLKWTNTELLMGQYWNPLFVTSCFPGTVSFNTGVPMQPFARNPQVRVTHSFGKIKIIAAALEQRDYTSRGPNPDPLKYSETYISSEYLRNSVIPDMHLQLHFSNSENIDAGINFEIKSIVPRLSSANYKVDESITSKSIQGFFKFKNEKFTFKTMGILGENNADVLSISGFAVKEITNPTSQETEYTPIRNVAAWIDAHTNGKSWQVGLFAGLNKNLGTVDQMSSVDNFIYGLGTDIDMLYRISPRVIFNSGKTRIAGEIEYTAADIWSADPISGTKLRTLDGLPTATTTVSNIRFLVSAYYFF